MASQGVLAQIISSMNALVSVERQGSRRTFGQGLQTLAKRRDLRYLDVGDIPEISRAELERFRQKRPDVEISD